MYIFKLIRQFRTATGRSPTPNELSKLKQQAEAMSAQDNIIQFPNKMEFPPKKSLKEFKASEDAFEKEKYITKTNKENKEAVKRFKEKMNKEKSLEDKLKDYDGDPDAMAMGGLAGLLGEGDRTGFKKGSKKSLGGRAKDILLGDDNAIKFFGGIETIDQLYRLLGLGGLYAKGGRIGTMSPDEYFSGKEKYMKQKQMEDMIREYEKYMRDQNMNRDEVAMGGRIGYAEGTEEPLEPINIGIGTFNPQRVVELYEKAKNIPKNISSKNISLEDIKGIPKRLMEGTKSSISSMVEPLGNEYRAYMEFFSLPEKDKKKMEEMGLGIFDVFEYLAMRDNKAQGGRIGYAEGTPKTEKILAAEKMAREKNITVEQALQKIFEDANTEGRSKMAKGGLAELLAE